MRRLLLVCLFIVGLFVAPFSFLNFQGLAANGDFETILLDFKEKLPSEVIQKDLQAIAKEFNVAPKLDNKFSARDNVYIIKGDRQSLNKLKWSNFAKHTEIIEPNYIYGFPKPKSGEIFREVEFVQPTDDEGNPKRNFQGINDPDYNRQWHLHNINVEGAWSSTKGKGITVAVIDSGVSKVRDLVETEFVKGYDFVNDRENANDDHGHGTHVAGTVAQATNNGYRVAGVAYEASIMPLKVLDESGAGTVADIAEAIKFAADKGADVINMSLGGGGESLLMKEAIEYAHKKGVVIIAAAGNENQNSASYPARYPHVIGVSAYGAEGEKASYSNFGAGVDISAPGGDGNGKVWQETIDPDNKGEEALLGFQGTSMASPHVAGVAALVKASGVKEPGQILAVIQQSAQAIADDKLNYYGAGKLNAAAAVQRAQSGQITFQDFFRWLRDNGYLNPGFWIDGGAVALLPKILMVVGSYLLAWFLRVYLPGGWNWFLSSGLVFGSSGLFFFRGFYIVDLPQWPFRLLGTSIPELGSVIQGADAFNPIFASVLIPFGLLGLFLGHPQWKWFAIGATLGMAACLGVSAVHDPAVWGLGSGIFARLFLVVNAVLCYALGSLAINSLERPAA